jgi:hypothetical protein
MSYKYEVQVARDPAWYDNMVAFATREEAQAAGQRKFDSWTLTVAFRVVESDQPVNYRWDPELGLVSPPQEVTAL